MNRYLCHYGLKGMKWGQRRWQYDDGRFNEAGKARYFGQNSTHRPDSVRVLQGDSPKQKSSGSSATSGQKKEFDKEKAKKIAKNVAIGAAIVGGTVLVAYGGYKIHQMGGVSNVAKNAVQKMNDLKIEKVRAFEQAKIDRAKIRSDSKQEITRIRENAKTDIQKLRDETKENIHKIKSDAKNERVLNSIDPDNRFDRKLVTDLSERMTAKDLRSRLKSLDAQEAAALNSGKVKLSDLRGRRANVSNDAYDSWISDVVRGRAGRIERPLVEKADQNMPSGMVRKISSNAVINRISSNAKIKTPAQIVSEYKKDHPNTELSPSSIVANYADKSSRFSPKPSAMKTPRSKITPQHLEAGAKAVSELNKTLQLLDQMNRKNEKKVKKSAGEVDDYTQELLRTGRK